MSEKKLRTFLAKEARENPDNEEIQNDFKDLQHLEKSYYENKAHPPITSALNNLSAKYEIKDDPY